MARGEDGRSNDVEVIAPDGRTYRVCTRRRGEPLRPWDGAETGFGPVDLLVFVGSLGQQLFSAARVRSHHGWTVGVLQDLDVRWKVVYREHIEDETLANSRAREVARAIVSGAVPR
jgi:hypothetical protein